MKEPKTWTPEKISQLRTEVMKMTFAEMGAVLGVHWNTVSRWENGVMTPTFALQRRLTEVLKERMSVKA